MTCRLHLLLVLIIFAQGVISYVKEAPDGSICFNNCNGHGDCVDYSCHCWSGYHGDDCGHTFVKEGEPVVPILSAGHYNLTRKNFTSGITKNKFILVGFSAYSCHRCIAVEPEYEKVKNALTILDIPFARADVDQMKSIALEHEANELPALVLFHKHRPLPYSGSHSSLAILTFIEKQISRPAITLKNVEEVESFILSRNSSRFSISTVLVIGFFAEYKDIEEDDYDDFIEAAKDLQIKEDIYFAVVTNKQTCDHYKKKKIIDRTPSVFIVGEEGITNSINLDELYGEKNGLKGWINKNAIPLVGKMTSNNFKLYEKTSNPMLMLFLDLTHETSTSNPNRIVGGKTGNILNENLLEELRHVAKEHSESITFVYLDGILHEDRMRTLGLFGGKERLPSIAFNTKDNLQIPFPEELPINEDTLLRFCADFLSGKLKSAADSADMAKKVMQSLKPISKKNKASRKFKKKAPDEVKGVSEQYGDNSPGDLAVIVVTTENFDEVVMDDEKDVMLMLHSEGCEPCSHLSVYYKHMANRFKESNIQSLVIARMDITNQAPPVHLNLVIGTLPIVVMLPAASKHPPWTFYSGVGKVAPLMKWAQQQATIPFELASLPHLNEEQKERYKVQVREREEYLSDKNKEDRRAMANEDRARKEVERQKRLAKKKLGGVADWELLAEEKVGVAEVKESRSMKNKRIKEEKQKLIENYEKPEGGLKRRKGTNDFKHDDMEDNDEF